MKGKKWDHKRNSMVSDIRPMHCLQLGVLQQLSRLCLESLHLLGAVEIVGKSSYPKGNIWSHKAHGLLPHLPIMPVDRDSLFQCAVHPKQMTKGLFVKGGFKTGTPIIDEIHQAISKVHGALDLRVPSMIQYNWGVVVRQPYRTIHKLMFHSLRSQVDNLSMPEVKKQKIVKSQAAVSRMKQLDGLKLKETPAMYHRV